MKPRRLFPLLALMLTAALLAALPLALRPAADIPGLTPARRTLLRVWVTSAPGGAQAWLTQQLRAFEKQHPGVMTHLRIVSPAELSYPDAVLPDVLLCMPGDLHDPAAFFTPPFGGRRTAGATSAKRTLPGRAVRAAAVLGRVGAGSGQRA